MKIKIKLHPGSSKEEIRNLCENEYEVWIKEKPIEGKANDYLEKMLKKYFGAEGKKFNIKIVKGLKSKNKIVEIKESIK